MQQRTPLSAGRQVGPRTAAAPLPLRRSAAGPRRAVGQWPLSVRIALVAMVLIFAGRIHEAIPGLPPLPLANLVVVFAAGALLLAGYAGRLTAVWRAPGAGRVLLLFGLAAAGIPFALWPGGAIGTLTSVVKLWVFFLLLVAAVRRPEQLLTVTSAFALAAGILVAGHLMEAAGFAGFRSRQSLAFDRNEIAVFAAMGIPYAIAGSVLARKYRWVGYALAGILAAGIVASGSRGGFLSMAAVGLLFLVRSRALTMGRKVALVVLGVAAVGVASSGEYWERIESMFTSPTEDYNFQAREGRIEIWKRGVGYVVSHPVTGVGIGNFPVAEGQNLENLGHGVKWSTAHNAYLLVAAELGVPGFVVFLGLLLMVYRAGSRARRLFNRPRAPPDLRTVGVLGEATEQSLVGFAVGAVFLSLTYSIAFVFLVTIGSCLMILSSAGLRRMGGVPDATGSGRSRR